MNDPIFPQTANPFDAISKELFSIKNILLQVQQATQRERGDVLPEIMSLKEAAVFLRVSASKLYQLTSKNQIPHYKQGARVIFNRSDLLAWLQQFMQEDVRTASASADDYISKNH